MDFTSIAISRWRAADCRAWRRRREPTRGQNSPHNSFRPAPACSISAATTALQRLLRTAAAIRAATVSHATAAPLRYRCGDFPTQAAARSDIIVMLGALERVADVENLFTHLRFCKRDVILSYSATDLAERRTRRARLRQRLELLRSRAAVRPLRLPHRMHRAGRRAQLLMRLTPAERLKPVARLQRRGYLRQRRRHFRRPARLPDDQCAAAGRGRRASSDFRDAG